MAENELFNDFEKDIKQKYGYMAEDMLCFFDDFKDFFIDEEITLNDFDTSCFDTLFENYLDYIGLSDAEFSMAFQTLIDFCEYCISKNIDLSAFKEYLLKEKESLYEHWTEEDYNSEFDDEFLGDFEDITPDEILEKFDSYYDVMTHSLKNKQMDVKEVQSNLERLYNFLNIGASLASKLREEKPTISEYELQKEVEKRLDEKDAQLLMSDDIWISMFSLPKEQSKKFMEFMIQLEENFDLEPGSKERKKSMENALSNLKALIDEINITENPSKK